MPHQIKAYVIDPLLYFLGIFVGSSLAGWASLIWEGKPISRRRLIAGTILSGFCGLIVGSTLWTQLGARDPFLVGAVSLTAGIGNAAVADLLVAGFSQWLKARLGLKDAKDEVDSPPQK